MTRRLRTPLVLAAVLSLLATGCGLNPFAAERTTVSATFDDVIDLVPQGSVRLNDVRVGVVEAIELTEDQRAEVTMSLDPGRPVPADLEAVLARTSVLGERYVDLVPLSDSPVCCVEDGTVIDRTSIRSDLEDVVAAGSGLLVDVSAGAVSTTIRTAAEAFGNRAELIGSFVDDVNVLVGTLDDNSDDLIGLIDALDRLTAAYAPNAAENAAVLDDLAVAAAALREQDEQLLDTLDDVTVLSGEAVGFLEPHQQEIANVVRRLRKLLQNVEEADADLAHILQIGPRYAAQLRRGALNGEAQVFLDVIVCGLTDTDGDVSRDCTPPNPGERTPNPPYYPVPEECYVDPEPCTGREDG